MRKSGQTNKTKAPAQIKSKKRVRERGEVFTAEREVKAMCDLIPEDEIWSDIAKTFLEPACGTGNFLVEIFERKLKYCKDEKDGLKALASIVGIDIMPDNVFQSRVRLMTMYCKAFPKASETSLLLAAGILQNNIICGDSLEIQKKVDRGEQYIPVISTIETDDGLEYLAEFKEFLFCGGSGKTEEEAIEDAYKNLEIYLEELTAPESCIVPASEMVEALHKIEKTQDYPRRLGARS